MSSSSSLSLPSINFIVEDHLDHRNFDLDKCGKHGTPLQNGAPCMYCLDSIDLGLGMPHHSDYNPKPYTQTASEIIAHSTPPYMGHREMGHYD